MRLEGVFDQTSYLDALGPAIRLILTKYKQDALKPGT